MARIEYSIPAAIAPTDGSAFGVYRPGVSVVGFDSGHSQSRIWSEHNLAVCEWRFDYVNASADSIARYEAFVRNVAIAGRPFWVIDPISGPHQGLLCGPLATGSRTTFPLPINGTASGVTVFLDGVPQLTSAYTIHGAANIVGDDTGGDGYAEADDAAKFTGANCSDAVVNFGVQGLSCLQMSPTGGGNSDEYTIGYAGVVDGEIYTSLIAVLETKASPRNFAAHILWYNASKTGLTASIGTASAATTGSWVIYTETDDSLDSGAAYARVRVRCGTSDTDLWYADAFALCPGDYDRWHLPSESPNLIEFASAPADGVRVTAAATGKRMARVRADATSITWSKITTGHALPSRLRMYEEIEVDW